MAILVECPKVTRPLRYQKADISKQMELQKPKITISSEQIFERIRARSPYVKKHEMTDLSVIDSEYITIKGIVNFFYVDNDDGDEYPYFGLLSQRSGDLIVQVFEELLDVFVIDGKYYFVSYWEEPDCGKRGLMIYLLEGRSLETVFHDYSMAT